MSSYLNVYAVDKKSKKNMCLFSLCTTPARELYPYLNCTCKDDNKINDYKMPLSKDKIESIIEYYTEQINTLKKDIELYEERKKELKEMLPCCKSKDVYLEMSENINDSMQFIEWATEEITAYTNYKSLFEFVNQIELNDFELWYSLD